MASIYLDGEYLEGNPDWHAGDSPAKARWIHQMLKRNAIAPATVAEVGCGAGGILVELQKHNPAPAYSGFEISPQAFAICGPKAGPGLEFHHQDILTRNDVHFDALMLIDVFEHVPDYMGFLEKLRGKADYKIFHIPLELTVTALLRGSPLLFARQSVGHIHYFSKDTALATLKDCGYEILDWSYTNGAMELPGRPFRTKVMNIARVVLQAVNKDFAARLVGGYSLLVLAR